MYTLNDINIPVGEKVFKVDTDFRSVIPIIEYEGDILSLLPNGYLQEVMSNYPQDLVEYKLNLDTITIQSNLFLKNEFPPIDDTTSGKTVSYVRDYAFIIASFQQQYNIDLLHTDFLDFRQFHILLSNMKQSVYNDIINIRTSKIPAGVSEKDREDLQKLKLQYDISGIEDKTVQEDWLEALNDIRGDVDV